MIMYEYIHICVCLYINQCLCEFDIGVYICVYIYVIDWTSQGIGYFSCEKKNIAVCRAYVETL